MIHINITSNENNVLPMNFYRNTHVNMISNETMLDSSYKSFLTVLSSICI